MGFRGPEVQILSFRPVGQGVAVSRNSFFLARHCGWAGPPRRVVYRRFFRKTFVSLVFRLDPASGTL